MSLRPLSSAARLLRRGVISLAFLSFATSLLAAEALVRREWVVDGVKREGLIYFPTAAASQPAPLVFAFHGHGGTARNASRSLALHEAMPEAIVVYLQGLPTPGALTDPEGRRNGWQSKIGAQGDRDLKFFDTVLAALRRDQRIDERRIYATGHSNGGAFTYLLWAARGDLFAAFAPSAALITVDAPKLKPKPALHIAGENDDLVKFSWQQAMIAKVRTLNQCGAGQPWESTCTLYPSKLGAPLLTYIHAGNHGFPKAAPALIATFFRQQARPQ